MKEKVFYSREVHLEKNYNKKNSIIKNQIGYGNIFILKINRKMTKRLLIHLLKFLKIVVLKKQL